MEKRNNKYNIVLKEVALKDGTTPEKSISFDFENHDNLFDIIEKIKAKALFDENASVEFAVGLKLFTEVMLTHKQHELFEELRPAIMEFMKKLKGKQ